jgi:hypothetical protein
MSRILGEFVVKRRHGAVVKGQHLVDHSNQAIFSGKVNIEPSFNASNLFPQIAPVYRLHPFVDFAPFLYFEPFLLPFRHDQDVLEIGEPRTEAVFQDIRARNLKGLALRKKN